MAESAQAADTASENHKRLREGLFSQLAHLIREVEMLEGVIGRVPERLLSEAPPGERFSIKETFGLLALLDETVHRSRLKRIVGEDEPRFAPFGSETLLEAEAWNERSMETIFARVRRARQGLIDAFKALPPGDWSRTGHFPGEPTSLKEEEGTLEQRDREKRNLYEMAHAVCLHDTKHLRAMSRRLYESHLGPPPSENRE